MRFKLDENLGTRGQAVLEGAGHDVATVVGQKMISAEDETLFRICAEEERVLVTLDLDFANPFRFPPEEGAGVAVLRLPANPGRDAIPDLVTVLIQAIARGESLERNLWIVESGRIRIFLNENE